MDMLVSTDWLAGELGADDVVVLDASLHLAGADRDARGEFADAHIPGARFLDLAGLHDPQSDMPGKVLGAAKVERRLADLGVGSNSRVVLYDDSTLRTACRAWFLLKVFGFEEVAVLDGGFGKWRAEGRPLANEKAKPEQADGMKLDAHRKMLRDKDQMLANVASEAEQVVDARDAGRFTAQTQDDVHDLPGGTFRTRATCPSRACCRTTAPFCRRPISARSSKARGSICRNRS